MQVAYQSIFVNRVFEMMVCGDDTVIKYLCSWIYHQIGFQEKLFKEVSWLSNYKYYYIHILLQKA